MIIILEGPDGAGKTTLARQLGDLTGFQVRHETRPTGGLFYYTQLVQERLTNLIFDRCHLGEAVYPPVLKDGRRPLSPAETYMLEMALVAQGAVLVYCHLPRDQVVKNLAERGDHLVSCAQVDEIIDGYERCLKTTILPTVYFNYHTWSIDQLTENVYDAYEQAYHGLLTAADLDATGFITGHPRMLVGDAINYHNKWAKPWWLPFTAAGGCATWFHQQLLRSGQRYYVTNSQGRNLRRELDRVDPGNVIALGRLAHRRLLVEGIFHDTCPHPQYLRRFKPSSNQLYEALQHD